VAEGDSQDSHVHRRYRLSARKEAETMAEIELRDTREAALEVAVDRVTSDPETPKLVVILFGGGEKWGVAEPLAARRAEPYGWYRFVEVTRPKGVTRVAPAPEA
jgi:hypothetical protein